MGNYKPRFVVRDLNVLEDRVIGKNGNHRKLVVEQDGVTRDVIWFNGEAKHPLRVVKAMVFTAEINVWRDRESVQLNAQYVETD
jgi:single-stranded-DNA-specific exonuclease